MCVNFQGKRTTLTFLAQICPKMSFRVGISENWCWNNNQHPWDTIRANFQTKQTTDFLSPKLPKNGFLGRNFKNQSLDSESAPETDHVSQFLLIMDNFEVFGLNLGKLPKFDILVRILRVLQRAGWRLKWAGWRWMELGGGWNELDRGGSSWVELGA